MIIDIMNLHAYKTLPNNILVNKNTDHEVNEIDTLMSMTRKILQIGKY